MASGAGWDARAASGRLVPPGVLLAVLGALLLISLVLAPLVGPTRISLAAALDFSIPAEENTDRIILLQLRLPRVLMAVAAGAALAAAGAAFQALLRNDLATPYTLGVSGGASFAALLMLHLGAGAAWMLPPAAFAGAAFAVVLILQLSKRAPSPDRMATLLLAGVTLNLVFAAGILMVQYLSDPFQTYQMIRWMMGALDVADLWIPLGVGVPALAAAAVLWRDGVALNLMTLGEDAAAHLGVEVERVRWRVLLVASGAAALVVAFVGPIGFVGLIAPHFVRRLSGPDHRWLVPSAAVAGALLLVVCDAAGRLIGGDREFPVGVLTACLGGPFFLAILFRRRY